MALTSKSLSPEKTIDLHLTPLTQLSRIGWFPIPDVLLTSNNYLLNYLFYLFNFSVF